MKIDQENFYWLFSSAAQSISTFVAFLLTGYALVLNVMDNLEGKDETLEEIHHKLKDEYYRKIQWLATLTGAAVVLSLLMVYLNGINWSWKPYLYIVTSGINAAVVVVGILFVVSIINPNRYKRAAKELFKTESQDFPESGKEVDREIFVNDFMNLERKIREKLEERNLDRRERGPSSFKSMVEALYRNRMLSPQELSELFKLARFRNFIVHGRQEKVDKDLLDAVKNAIGIIDRIR